MNILDRMGEHMVQSGETGRIVVRSRLKELVAQRERRENRRITNEEIAAQTDLNPNTISRWMSPVNFSRFESKPLINLCRWLDCTPGDLIYLDEEDNGHSENNDDGNE